MGGRSRMSWTRGALYYSTHPDKSDTFPDTQAHNPELAAPE